MSDLLAHLMHWWSGGDVLMPIMLAVAIILYAIIGERAWVLCGPDSRRLRRRDELQALLRDHTSHEQQQWALTYAGLAEEIELSRGFMVIRALTAALPLCGLLGTVTGMVDTFGSLAQGANGGSAQQASAGIGLALTATQYGMGLAIPAVCAEWFLRSRVKRLIHDRNTFAATLTGAVL